MRWSSFLFVCSVSFACGDRLFPGGLVPERPERHRHLATFQRRWLLDLAEILHRIDEPSQDALAVLGTFTFPPAEAHGHLDLVAVRQPFGGAPGLHVEVVLGDAGSETCLLDDGPGLILPGFTLAYGLLVLVLAVVHDLADGWLGGGSDLYEIHLQLLGQPQRFGQFLHPVCEPSGATTRTSGARM